VLSQDLGIFVSNPIKKSENIMKQELWTKVLAATACALSGLTVAFQPSYGQRAPGESGFRCSTSTGAPVTVYQNPQGAVEPWIEWTSHYFSGSGYDPATRCQLVSQRLETYRRQRVLKYITAGPDERPERHLHGESSQWAVSKFDLYPQTRSRPDRLFV
jgi:hypothetical protein